jgi:hypothetical protein
MMTINMINVWELYEDSGANEGDLELPQSLSRSFRSVPSPETGRKMTSEMQFI